MAKFKVGDKVKVRSWKSMAKEYGVDCGAIQVPCVFVPAMSKYCGTVVTIKLVTSGGRYKIEEDGKENWTFSEQMFEPGVIAKTKHSPKKATSASVNKVTIYTEDRKVIAVDESSGKTAMARCHPEDKFDFFIGAEIALERLKAECKKPKYYSGEIVCTKASGAGLTKGKIYTVKDGKFVDDYGEVHGTIYPYTSFKNLVDQHWSEFIEIVR